MDELLTTGEAALMLNSSRQHVVDLCDLGDVSFTTVGTHRRVRRADVEMLTNGPNASPETSGGAYGSRTR